MPSLSIFPLIITCLILSFCLSSCSSVSKMVGARHKYDHAQNFEGMQRYNFSPTPEQIENNADFRFIRNSGAALAIENAMAAKQIRKERYATPDFWLNYYFTGEQGITVGQLNQLYTYNLGLAWDDKYGTGQGVANTDYRYSRRTLIIDLVAREGKRLIWRGYTPTGITQDQPESQTRKALNSAVEVILDAFPPENIFGSLKSSIPE